MQVMRSDHDPSSLIKMMTTRHDRNATQRANLRNPTHINVGHISRSTTHLQKKTTNQCKSSKSITTRHYGNTTQHTNKRNAMQINVMHDSMSTAHINARQYSTNIDTIVNEYGKKRCHS